MTYDLRDHLDTINTDYSDYSYSRPCLLRLLGIYDVTHGRISSDFIGLAMACNGGLDYHISSKLVAVDFIFLKSTPVLFKSLV